MRLIDADKLRWDIRNNAPRNVPMWVYDTIDAQSTAYDVDKVVKELEELKSRVPVNRVLDNITRDCPKELGQIIAYDRAIEIVRDGGKNDA